MDVALDIGSLGYFQDELFDLRSKWYNIGVQINIDIGTLQSIKSEFSNDNGDALRELLTHWLKGTPTWEELFRALRSRPVGAHDIAAKLQKGMKEQLFPDSVPEAPVQYTPKGRNIRVDSQLMPGSPPVAGISSSGRIEQQNPLYIPEVLHIPVVEPAISLEQEYSMMKMPSTSKVRNPDFKFKVIVIGESGVGKTSILNRFLNPEIQVKSHKVTVVPMKPEGTCFIEVDRAFHVQLTIWDTAGMERLFNFIPEHLFRDVDAALIVFDVRERETFRRAISDITEAGGTTRKSWFKVVNDRSGDIPPVKILVGNMIDCQGKSRKVTEKQGREKAQLLGIEYIEASSLENINIDKIFFKITRLLVERARNNPSPRGDIKLDRGRRHNRSNCHC